MANCKALEWNNTTRGNERCNAPCPPGFAFCEKHKGRKGGIKEREKAALNNFAEDINPLINQNPPTTPIDTQVIEGELEEVGSKEIEKARTSSTIYEKVDGILSKTAKFTEDAERRYRAIPDDQLRYYDKAGAEQLRSEVAVYERALDRDIRALTAVAKLNLEQQAINVNNVVRELIVSVAMRVFVRMGLDAEQTKQARLLFAEEFAKLDKEK